MRVGVRVKVTCGRFERDGVDKAVGCEEAVLPLVAVVRDVAVRGARAWGRVRLTLTLTLGMV